MASAWTRFTTVLRLHPISKEAPNAATAAVCWKDNSHPRALDSPQHKWSALQQYTHWVSTVHQARAYTYLDPSALSHSKWQGLEPSIPLTLLTVDYGPEIVGGDNADGVLSSIVDTRPSLDSPPTSNGNRNFIDL